MTKIPQKIPFVMELLFNGIFILLYAIKQSDFNISALIAKDNLELIISFLAYLAPLFVFISILSFYKSSQSMDEFIRKYVFSIIVFIPMLFTMGDTQFIFWLSAVHLFSSILSLSDIEKPKVDKVSSRALTTLERIRIAPAQIVLISFFAIILIGTLLLSLPISAAQGHEVSFIDAFFIATSATCVTGLSSISIADNFSFTGQLIVLFLFQIGALGYMTLHASMMILLGKSFNIKNKIIMQDLLDISSVSDLISMIFGIIRYTLIIEFIGAIILTFAFSFEGHEIGDALYYGFFHAISAFCNAGFSLFNNSLEDFATNPFISLTVSCLVILGGLGFIVLKELELVILRKKKIINLSVHTKVVVLANIIITTLVTLYIFFTEYLGALSGYGLFDQFQLSFFQSMATRSAGFNTIPMDILHQPTLYLMCLVMFIGAAPGSTGGGIKVTTFAILFQSVRATLKGKDRVEFFDRVIPHFLVVKAIAIIIISLMIASFGILLMLKLEPNLDFLSIFFEVVSASATVGLSMGITSSLGVAAKSLLIILMFVGRVGPLTLAIALGQSSKQEGEVHYPTGKLLIG